jgi:hypothetical protein
LARPEPAPDDPPSFSRDRFFPFSFPSRCCFFDQKSSAWRFDSRRRGRGWRRRNAGVSRPEVGFPSSAVIRFGRRGEQYFAARLSLRRLQPVGAPQGAAPRREAAGGAHRKDASSATPQGASGRLQMSPICEAAARGPQSPPGHKRPCRGEPPPRDLAGADARHARWAPPRLEAAVSGVDGCHVLE